MVRKPIPRFKRHRNEPMPVRSGAFELRKRGATKFDWRDPYYLALSANWRWFIVALIALNVTLNTIFACLYLLQPGSIANAKPGSFAAAFFFSVETLATVGYGVMAPATIYGHIVSTIEILCGMAYTAIMTGLTFVRFSRAKAKILYAEKAVVTRHHGRRTLMIRIANARLSPLTDARVRLGALIAETTPEGQFYRRIHDLPLERDFLPLFPLTWTVMHVLDRDSPLRGCDPDKLVNDDVRLILSLQARDPLLSAIVQDSNDYAASDVVFGMRYADAVSIDEQGRTVADLNRISLVEPENVEEEQEAEEAVAGT